MPKYPGTGLASMLNAGQQATVINNERAGAGTPNYASAAVLLERQKSSFYPWGFAVEVAFTGAPGTFEVDVQGAEVDQDSHYILLGTAITAVNANNVGRFDNVTTVYPKFVRVFIKTLGNDVYTTAIITR